MKIGDRYANKTVLGEYLANRSPFLALGLYSPFFFCLFPLCISSLFTLIGVVSVTRWEAHMKMVREGSYILDVTFLQVKEQT